MPLEAAQGILMVIAERTLAADLGASVAAAVRGGARLVQLREKHLPAGELLALARSLKARCGPARFLVNGRLDVALAARADGVHLPGGSLPAAAARRLAPPGFLIGRSVHDLEEARAAQEDGADYVLAGPVFATGCKPGAAARGLAWLKALAGALSIPVLALGGMDDVRAGEAVAVGAAGAAARSFVLGSGDPEGRARCACESMAKTFRAPVPSR